MSCMCFGGNINQAAVVPNPFLPALSSSITHNRTCMFECRYIHIQTGMHNCPHLSLSLAESALGRGPSRPPRLACPAHHCFSFLYSTRKMAGPTRAPSSRFRASVAPACREAGCKVRTLAYASLIGRHLSPRGPLDTRRSLSGASTVNRKPSHK